jgi:hypothetical protein
LRRPEEHLGGSDLRALFRRHSPSTIRCRDGRPVGRRWRISTFDACHDPPPPWFREECAAARRKRVFGRPFLAALNNLTPRGDLT